MPIRRGMPGLIAGLLILIIGSVVPLIAGDKAAEPGTNVNQLRVQINLISGESITGRLLMNVIKMRSDYGYQELNPAKIKRIIVRPPGQPEAMDAIEIAGLDHLLHGDLLTATFPVEISDQQRLIPRGEIRTVKFLVSRPTGLFTGIIIPLVTLTAMEIVLGIDNIIFLAIIAGRLPKAQQPAARKLGLGAALITRLLLLATLSFLLNLTNPIFTLPRLPFLTDLEAREISWKDLILLGGGLFLIAKSTYEIHQKLESDEHREDEKPARAGRFGMVLVQIAIIDIVFSLDSVITAVGMVETLWIMMTAVVIAVGVMLVFAGAISNFIARNPTLKILALAFLILIGVMLVVEGLGQHIDKGYIYFAMAFSVAVEMLNLKFEKKFAPLKLKGSELPRS